MKVLDQLKKKHELPAYAETLNQFKRRSVAKMVGVSTGYICNVLSGSKEPSQALEQRLIELAEQVKAEMQQSEPLKQ